MLRFVEEILLLLIHDDGRTAHVPSWVLDYAIAGGVLMDLALENRIDTDPQRLILVDSTPVGDTILDPAPGRNRGRGPARHPLLAGPYRAECTVHSGKGARSGWWSTASWNSRRAASCGSSEPAATPSSTARLNGSEDAHPARTLPPMKFPTRATRC